MGRGCRTQRAHPDVAQPGHTQILIQHRNICFISIFPPSNKSFVLVFLHTPALIFNLIFSDVCIGQQSKTGRKEKEKHFPFPKFHKFLGTCLPFLSRRKYPRISILTLPQDKEWLYLEDCEDGSREGIEIRGWSFILEIEPGEKGEIKSRVGRARQPGSLGILFNTP